VVEDLIPEPFIDAVTTASVMVLQLNPGLDPVGDPIAHADLRFRKALFANLRHEASDWPFHFLDPRFRQSTPGGRWWTARTKKLAEAVGYERLAKQLAVVEWFPYKSTRFKPGCRVDSQQYGLFLVSSAIRRGALIVISRRAAWWEHDPTSV